MNTLLTFLLSCSFDGPHPGRMEPPRGPMMRPGPPGMHGPMFNPNMPSRMHPPPGEHMHPGPAPFPAGPMPGPPGQMSKSKKTC